MFYGWSITDVGENGFLTVENKVTNTKTNLKGDTTVLAFDQDAGFKMTTDPNPSSVAINVSFSAPTKIKEFRFFDVQGRLVKTIVSSDSEPKKKHRLEVYNLAPGTYFLQVLDAIGLVHRKQLLIKR